MNTAVAMSDDNKIKVSGSLKALFTVYLTLKTLKIHILKKIFGAHRQVALKTLSSCSCSSSLAMLKALTLLWHFNTRKFWDEP